MTQPGSDLLEDLAERLEQAAAALRGRAKEGRAAERHEE